MAKRRGDSPLSIVVMGIFTIALFGGFVAYFGSTKPILLLDPVLEEEYGSKEFRTQFFPSRSGLRSYILVEVPPELAGTKDRIQVGVFALHQYLELAEGLTQVEACHVTVKDRPELTEIVVSEALVYTEEATRKAVSDLEIRLRELGLRKPRITVVGLYINGTEIKVEGIAPDPKTADALAKKVMKTLLAEAPTASLIGLTVTARGKPEVKLVGGVDAPKPVKNKPRKAGVKPKPGAPGSPPAPGWR